MTKQIDYEVAVEWIRSMNRKKMLLLAVVVLAVPVFITLSLMLENNLHRSVIGIASGIPPLVVFLLVLNSLVKTRCPSCGERFFPSMFKISTEVCVNCGFNPDEVK